MSNLTITTNDNSSVVLQSNGTPEYVSGTFTAAGAKTYPAGTILAVDSSTLKYVVFAKGGSTNDNGIPKAILGTELTTTGAGDVAIRPLVSAVVNFNKLVIDADGDNSNIDLAVKDQLRDYTIIVKEVDELSSYDNQ